MYSIYAPPATARLAGQTFATVYDQGGNLGGTCVPDPTKLARFVTNLLTRYPQIKYLAAWNEPKANKLPIVRSGGSTVQTLTAGTTVIGNTSGARAKVISTINSGATTLTMEMLDYSYNNPIAFATNETITVEPAQTGAGNTFTGTTHNTLMFWAGSNAQLVSMCQNIYTTAKAVRSDIIVMNPEFTDGTAAGEANEWLAEWLDAGGIGYFDALAYHFYNFDIRPSRKSGDANSIQALNRTINNILAARNITIDKYATECGYTPGWTFWNQTGDRASQAQTIKRVASYLAATGWKSNIWFTHTQEYDGAPASNAVISQALKWCGDTLSGRTVTDAYISNSNVLHFKIDGIEVSV